MTDSEVEEEVNKLITGLKTMFARPPAELNQLVADNINNVISTKPIRNYNGN